MQPRRWSSSSAAWGVLPDRHVAGIVGTHDGYCGDVHGSGGYVSGDQVKVGVRAQVTGVEGQSAGSP